MPQQRGLPATPDGHPDHQRTDVPDDASGAVPGDLPGTPSGDATEDATGEQAGDVRDEVRRAVESVPDPEMPSVTIGMLGMVHALHEDHGSVRVELLPTFAGCPATEMIRRDVEAALHAVDEVTGVEVVFRFSPVWTPERITSEGRERLVEFGIAPPVAPPGSQAGAVGADAAVTVLPIVSVTEATRGRPCPWCGSTATERDSAFGPTPCRDLWMCTACRQPFEGFKSA